jgi:hypothetical protein
MRTLTLLGAVLFVLPAIAAEGDFKAMFAKQWQVAKEFTLAVAETMPADGYGFKPNPAELSFGQLMIHIAAQNGQLRERDRNQAARQAIERGVARPDR